MWKDNIKANVRNEFFQKLEVIPYYQPIVDIQKKLVFGFEALSRFKLEDIPTPPGKVFQMASSFGLVGELDLRCRRKAVESFPLKDVKLFVNISPLYILTDEFGKRKTEQIVNELNFKKEQLVLEITDAGKVQDINIVKKTLEHYRSMGFMVGIDDVGIGYNSLYHLTELENLVDFVKLPTELINGISKSDIRRKLTRMLSDVVTGIGAKLIFEGVESEEDLEILVWELGATLLQGYMIGKPMEASLVQSYKPSFNIAKKNP